MKKTFTMNEILVNLNKLYAISEFESARTLKTKANYAMAKNKETFEGLKKAFYAPILLTEKEDQDARAALQLDAKAPLTFDMLKEKSELLPESVAQKVERYFSELKATDDFEIHTIKEDVFSELPTEIAMLISWMVD